MAITTCVFLDAASLLPALIASIGRCFWKIDQPSFALVFLCSTFEATPISAFFHSDYMTSQLDMNGQLNRMLTIQESLVAHTRGRNTSFPKYVSPMIGKAAL